MARALVVYKMSTLERLETEGESYSRLKKEHARFARSLDKGHQAHQRSLKKVVSELKQAGWHVDTVHRARVSQTAQVDLVVSVGGDGTFLEAARYVRDTPVLSVNSDKVNSVAHFSLCTAEGFAAQLKKLGSRELPLRTLSRLEILINNEPIDRTFLNDILLANRNPAATSRFRIKPDKKIWKCSGIWVATAAGSTAAIHSAGGQVLPLFSQKWQYLVREPYGWNQRKRLGHLMTGEGQLEIVCQSTRSRIYIDGAHQSLKLNYGDTIKVKKGRPLKVYCKIQPKQVFDSA